MVLLLQKDIQKGFADTAYWGVIEIIRKPSFGKDSREPVVIFVTVLLSGIVLPP